MSVGYATMNDALQNSMVDVTFFPRSGGPRRRMLCTNSVLLLNSAPGRMCFHWSPPKGVGLPYIPAEKGLIVAYDLLQQRYRQIPLETATIVWAFKLQTRDDLDAFWEYFRQYLRDMSAADKIAVMRR
jgi:hypothetical protein